MLIGGEASLLFLLPALGVADTFQKFYIHSSSPNPHEALFSNPYFPDEDAKLRKLPKVIELLNWKSLRS